MAQRQGTHEEIVHSDTRQPCGCYPESRPIATPWPMPEFNDCVKEYFVVLIRQDDGVLRHDACGKAWPEETLPEQEA